jgi:hypothetical protein
MIQMVLSTNCWTQLLGMRVFDRPCPVTVSAINVLLYDVLVEGRYLPNVGFIIWTNPLDSFAVDS